MGWCARAAGKNSLAIALAAAIIALFCLLLAAERRLGLHQSASTRYRFHAIPVAISTLCHHHPHDYTAIKSLAIRFHDPARDLDVQIREAIDADLVTGGGTYYWVADDRGLADFVLLAFQLFGPQAESLSNFWFLLLASSLALYTIAFWRKPTALVVPLLILLGWVAAWFVAPIMHGAGVAALVLLIVGGALYSIGGVLYALKWPNPWPTTFGHHEFFHACTAVAAICHYIAMWFAVFW